MKRIAKSAIKRALGRLNLAVLSQARYQSIIAKDEVDQKFAEFSQKLAVLDAVAVGDPHKFFAAIRESKSQLGQDLVVLNALGWKRDGYFVEFGATNGETLSNSWLLEQQFGWHGILAEPGRVWREALKNSGRTADLEFDCVWDKTGETLSFLEADYAELSTIGIFADRDQHSSARRQSHSYDVNTISLNDLLKKHEAPKAMDYLSIDTEGSELKILQSFDFSTYRFSVITCEHNFTSDREDIFHLLTSQGYVRKFEKQSQFDDWYFYEG